jgi:hypothetical protein
MLQPPFPPLSRARKCTARRCEAMPDHANVVPMPNLDQFARSGIYFLHCCGEVVYVGQAVDVRRRLGNHVSEGTKPFDAVSMMPCDVDDLDARERHFIQQLLPRYNSCRFSQLLREAGAAREEDRPWMPILKRHEVAAYLGVTDATLGKWEAEGRGPPKSRLPRSKARVYRLTEVRAFARTIQP